MRNSCGADDENSWKYTSKERTEIANNFTNWASAIAFRTCRGAVPPIRSFSSRNVSYCTVPTPYQDTRSCWRERTSPRHSVQLQSLNCEGQWRDSNSNAAKQLGQALFQPLRDLLDIHQRHIPDATLDATVVRPVQAASLGSLFLIDLLFLADATDRAAKPDADIEWHRSASWRSPADAYTPDESHCC